MQIWAKTRCIKCIIIKMQGLTGALVTYLICTSLDQMLTLISTSMPSSITNGDLSLLAQKQTIVKIEICTKYDILKEITSLHFHCLLNMIMLEHLEAASPLTRTGAGQRTERKIRYIDKERFSTDICRYGYRSNCNVSIWYLTKRVLMAMIWRMQVGQSTLL